MRHHVLLLLISLFIAGCSIGPNYERPELAVPVALINADNIPMDETIRRVANTEWWLLFGDPVLTDMIKTALIHNNDVRIAAARVEQYMGMYGVAISDFLPKIDAGGSAAYMKNSTTGGDPKSAFSVNASASWELDIWGKVRRANEAARADLLAVEEARRGMVLLITTQVADSYIKLLSFDRQLEIAKMTAESRKKTLELYKMRRDGGEISDMVVSQLESEYWYTQEQIPLIENKISRIEHALSVLLGRNPGAIVRGKTLAGLQIPVVPEGIPSVLLERRPDVRQAEDELIAANARIGVAKAQYFPSISLTGMFGTVSTDLTSLFKPGSTVFSVGGNFLGPIFHGGEIKAMVKASEAVQKQALYAYVRTVQTAFQDTEDALVDKARTYEKFSAEEKRIAALATYARLATLRYDEGLTGYIEVLDAERALFSAQLDHTQTNANLLVSVVNIYRALAGGWVDYAATEAFEPNREAERIRLKDQEKVPQGKNTDSIIEKTIQEMFPEQKVEAKPSESKDR